MLGWGTRGQCVAQSRMRQNGHHSALSDLGIKENKGVSISVTLLANEYTGAFH